MKKRNRKEKNKKNRNNPHQFIEENHYPHKIFVLVDVLGIPKADEATNNGLSSSAEAKRVESEVVDDDVSDGSTVNDLYI